MPDLNPRAVRELAAVDDALAGRPVDPDLSVWEELTQLLAEERPTPDPDFTSRLDVKVAGFRSAPARRPQGGRARWRVLFGPALGLVAAGCLVLLVASFERRDGFEPGAGGGGGSAESAGGGGGEEGATAGSAGPDESSGQATDSAGSLAEPLPPLAPTDPGGSRADGRGRRTVARSATLTLGTRPRDVDAVSARIQAVTAGQGGFVASSSVSSGDGGYFTLRIPVRNLDAAVAALARLGTVRERSQASQDITGAVVSAAERLQEAHTERRALLRRLAAAQTPAQSEAIRRRLDGVARELAAARAGRRRVANRGAYATVAVTLAAEASADDTDPGGAWTLGDALDDAGRILQAIAGVVLLLLAVLVPLALVAAPLALAARRVARLRREHALDSV